MAVKSVLDIDINDEKFKRFSALFDKYQSALGKLPGMWKDVDKETAGAAATFANITAAMMAQSHVQNEANEAARNSGKELQHQQQRDRRPVPPSSSGIGSRKARPASSAMSPASPSGWRAWAWA